MIVPPTLEAVRTLYDSGLSLFDTAEQLGWSLSTIHKVLNDAGVARRLPYIVNNLVLSPPLLELLDGLLLGDASYEVRVKTRNISSKLVISQADKRLGWLQEIQKRLSKFNVAATIAKKKVVPSMLLTGPRAGTAVLGGPASRLRTTSYAELATERLRWYPEPTRKKIVPRDIKLTSMCLAQWYFGDGSCTRDKDTKRARITLCTNSFSPADVDFLAETLRATYGWDVRRYDSQGPIICVGKQAHVLEFHQLIEPFTPPCLRYKLTEDLR